MWKQVGHVPSHSAWCVHSALIQVGHVPSRCWNASSKKQRCLRSSIQSSKCSTRAWGRHLHVRGHLHAMRKAIISIQSSKCSAPRLLYDDCLAGPRTSRREHAATAYGAGARRSPTPRSRASDGRCRRSGELRVRAARRGGRTHARWRGSPACNEEGNQRVLGDARSMARLTSVSSPACTPIRGVIRGHSEANQRPYEGNQSQTYGAAHVGLVTIQNVAREAHAEEHVNPLGTRERN